ncbi:MAG: septum site-determining protein MinD [Bacillota bacterium]|jgi:septum site-determining protein MinD
MGESIVITSGKGGVGKSTTTINLGVGLALLGKKVCMIDADIGLRNLDVLIGLENRIVYDLVDVVESKCTVEKALIRDKRCPELYLLPAAQTKDKTDISSEQLQRVVIALKETFDYILIDSPAGIEAGFKHAVLSADKAIIVTTPENPAIRDADRVVGLLDKYNISSPKLIINKLHVHMARSGGLLGVDEVVAVLSIDLLGVVPDSDAVISAGHLGEPIIFEKTTLVSKSYRNIAKRIQGDVVPLLSFSSSVSFFTKIKKLIGVV